MTTTACTTFRVDEGGLYGAATITDGKFINCGLSNRDTPSKTTVYLPFGSLIELDAAISILAQLRDAVAAAQGIRLS